MRINTQTFSILFTALCLQACVGKGIAFSRLGAKELPNESNTAQACEVPWQTEMEDGAWHTPPLLGGMQEQDSDAKSRTQEVQVRQEAQQAEGKRTPPNSLVPNNAQQSMTLAPLLEHIKSLTDPRTSRQQAPTRPLDEVKNSSKRCENLAEKALQGITRAHQSTSGHFEQIDNRHDIADAEREKLMEDTAQILANQRQAAVRHKEAQAALLEQLKKGQLTGEEFSKRLDALQQSIAGKLQQHEASQAARLDQFLKSLTSQLIVKQPASVRGEQEAKQALDSYRAGVLKDASEYQAEAFQHRVKSLEFVYKGILLEIEAKDYRNAARAYKEAIRYFGKAKKSFEEAQELVSSEHELSRLGDEEYNAISAMLKQHLATLPTPAVIKLLTERAAYLKGGQAVQPPTELLQCSFLKQQLTIENSR